MQNQMPQEIEVWYIIPALRREVAKAMINDFECTQKQVAQHMAITEAAVSQYLHSKRAKDVVFSKEILREIRNAAEKIVKNNTELVPEMIRLTKLSQIKHIMCDIHKKQDTNLPKGCDVCFEDETIQVKVK